MANRYLLVAGGLWLLFAAIIVWFQYTDWYNTGFQESGFTVFFYNLLRFIFIFLLHWLICAPGYLLLQRFPLSLLSRHLLSFAVGTGMWTLVLLIIGSLGLYQTPLAIALSVVVFALSIPALARVLPHMRDGCAALCHLPASSKLMAFLLAITLLVFLQVKAIYPVGWHDYFTHYFFYYMKVIETGSIAPNEIWYHFFYVKAGGLYFLAMLLSDPLAPALAAAAFLLTGGLLVYALVARVALGIWPLTAVVLYFALQIYIRGAGYGAWGHLPKFHELTAVLMLFVFWACLAYGEQARPHQRAWLVALAFAVVTAILYTLAMAVVLGLFFGLLLIHAYSVKNRPRAWHMFLLGALCVNVLLAVCLANYLITGVPTDYYMEKIWHLLDWEKIHAWGVSFEMASVLHERDHVSSIDWSPRLITRLFYRFLRLDLLYAVLVVALLSAVLFRKKPATPLARDWPVYALFIIATMGFAYAVGAGNPVSFYRFSSFAFAPMLCFAFYLLAASRFTTQAKPALAFMVVVLAVATSYIKYPKVDVQATFTNVLAFASGAYSIDDAYSHQRALPADAKAEGVIHPASRAVYELLGPRTRVWAFSPFNYCMLPDCGLESHIFFRMTRRPLEVFFSNASRAKAVLKDEGLNYFLITTSLEIRDPLAKTELFSPKYIARHLHLLWSDGDSALLTWPGKNTRPIPPEWLKRYRESVSESGYIASFPLEQIGERLQKSQ